MCWRRGDIAAATPKELKAARRALDRAATREKDDEEQHWIVVRIGEIAAELKRRASESKGAAA
jgi:hypothetical protein